MQLNTDMTKIYHNFFRLKEDFHIYKKGDCLLFGTCHNDIVLLGSATTPTKYYTFWNSVKDYNTYNLRWYADALKRNLRAKCEPLTKYELIKLFPHLTKRIKFYEGYFELAKYLPDYMCEECITKANLEVRKDGWENHFKIGKNCWDCKKVVKGKVYARNALKPINL